MNRDLLKTSGMLSIESKNIFSILQKWLYTEQDIVFRELISNSIDAIEKRLTLQNDFTLSEGNVHVVLDEQTSTLTIEDNGVGMTEEEVHKYINQIAFSGAADFINSYSNSSSNSIIGHFGVGFYSSFMFADHVAIETKAHLKDEPAVRWDCDNDMSYNMKSSEKVNPGTKVILYLNSDNMYFSKPQLAYEAIHKYFVFAKIPVYFTSKAHDHVLVNILDPEWKKVPEIIDQEKMNGFYKDFFNDVSDPLFWIPFESADIGIRGVLYFRDTKNGTAEIDGTVKVYSRGVYIGDNIRELIPDFVNLQNGIIECDDLPLVVSRSSLRDEKDQKEILSLIHETLTQEVTIAINNMFENNRKDYEQNWPNLNAFMKYAILKDKIFASVMMRKVIYQDIYGKYLTIQEYLNENSIGTQEETIYYSSDNVEQSHYIQIFKNCNLNALLFDHVIDQPFMQHYEVAKPNFKFIRIDSDIESLFEGYENEGDKEKQDILKNKAQLILDERKSSLSLKITNLPQKSISSLIINDEKARRMADMLEIYGLIGQDDYNSRELQSKSTLLLNMNNPIIDFLISCQDLKIFSLVMNHILDLALLSTQNLKPEDVENFITRSESLLLTSLSSL